MSICSLLKTNKQCPLLIHSNLELYILHTYIRLCGTVHLLEFDQKHTHTQKDIRTTTGRGGGKRSEVIGLHAAEVPPKKRKKKKEIAQTKTNTLFSFSSHFSSFCGLWFCLINSVLLNLIICLDHEILRERERVPWITPKLIPWIETKLSLLTSRISVRILV